MMNQQHLPTTVSTKTLDILKSHQDMIASGWVQILPEMATFFAKLGHEEAARSLNFLAAPLAAEIVNPSMLTPPDTSLAFLVNLLQTTYESQNEPQPLYELLSAHPAKLTPHLIYLLQSWATLTLSIVSLKEAVTLANLLVDFGGTIWTFPDGDEAINQDMAIACCESALHVYNATNFPREWGLVHNNLAFAYNHRLWGDRQENLQSAFNCYQKACQLFTRQPFPNQWVMISSE